MVRLGCVREQVAAAESSSRALASPEVASDVPRRQRGRRRQHLRQVVHRHPTDRLLIILVPVAVLDEEGTGLRARQRGRAASPRDNCYVSI